MHTGDRRVLPPWSSAQLRPVLLGWVFLALFLELGLIVASHVRPDVVFDVGPSTGSYGSGLNQSWEYLPVTARFVGERVSLLLPVDIHPPSNGEMRLTVRSARLWRSSLDTVVSIGGEEALSFTSTPSEFDLNRWARDRQGSPFENFETHAGSFETRSGPLDIDFSHAPGPVSPFALAIDWLKVEGAKVRVPARAYQVRLLVLGLLPILLVSGWSPRVAISVAAGTLGLVLVWAGRDPFALVHVSSRVVVPGLVTATILAFISRRWISPRWPVLLFLIGFGLKAAGVFAPSFFYADVRSHRRYALAYQAQPGNFWEQGIGAQKRAGIGYPGHVAGKDYAFPYSPLFYLPFLPLVPDDERIDEGMKLVALIAAALESVVVFAVSRAAFGHRTALFAGWVAVFLPPLYSRLLLAMWPSIVGHLINCLAMAMAAFVVARPKSREIWWAYWCALSVSLAFYVTSPITVGAFVAALALFERRAAARLLVPLAVVMALTSGLLYWPFIFTLVREIIPTVLSTEGPVTLTEPSTVSALNRTRLFFGWAYPVLTLAGIVLTRRHASAASRSLLAYTLAFLILVGFRVFGLGLFKWMKEILFVGPLVAIASGFALATLSERGRIAWLSAALLMAGLAGWGMAHYASYLEPVTFLEGLESLD